MSVRVRDLVYAKRSTSYKEVADDLIKEFACKEEEGGLYFDTPANKLDDSEDDDLEQNGKEEKNVRRRVYDALNVLIAADVLQKNGKQVYFAKKSKAQSKATSETIEAEKRKAEELKASI